MLDLFFVRDQLIGVYGFQYKIIVKHALILIQKN